jgi:holo-[acyl-carrier protein] synthase
MTDVQEVRDSIASHGDRYLHRVYTQDERLVCGTSPRRLAARFAAKEATMKALECEDRLPWHSIAVAHDAAGRPVLALSGPASELARKRGVCELSVSLTHAALHAAAVVLARTA